MGWLWHNIVDIYEEKNIKLTWNKIKEYQRSWWKLFSYCPCLNIVCNSLPCAKQNPYKPCKHIQHIKAFAVVYSTRFNALCMKALILHTDLDLDAVLNLVIKVFP